MKQILIQDNFELVFSSDMAKDEKRKVVARCANFQSNFNEIQLDISKYNIDFEIGKKAYRVKQIHKYSPTNDQLYYLIVTRRHCFLVHEKLFKQYMSDLLRTCIRNN